MSQAMPHQDMLDRLAKIGAVITNSHLVYTSGKHGSAYMNKDAIYPHTAEISQLCRKMAEDYAKDGIEAVLAPATGGIILCQWVAHHLSEMTGRDVLAVYAEKEGDGFVIKRGYDKLIAGKKTLVVEDLLTTGGSVKKVIEVAKGLGAQIAGLAVLCNRGGVAPEAVGNPPRLTALLDIKLDSWEEADCPLCKQGVAINTDVGHGRQYLARKEQAKASA